MRIRYTYTAAPVVKTEEFLQCIQSGFLIKEDNLGRNQVRFFFSRIFFCEHEQQIGGNWSTPDFKVNIWTSKPNLGS